MKFSVLIPAYNAAATVDSTIQSVLKQTLPPFEILVVDDGSKDDTLARLKRYEPRITVFPVANAGVSPARNLLCSSSRGDILAFLDADDVWHPTYLEKQAEALSAHPEAVASYARFTMFRKDEDLVWPEPAAKPVVEVLAPLEFFRVLNHNPMFYIPSCCCVRREVFADSAYRPFPEVIKTTEDFYVFNTLPLYGSVLRSSSILMGYRLTPGSLSSDWIIAIGRSVQGMELLAQRKYRNPPPHFSRPFKRALATWRRVYAKHLMGVANVAEARRQIQLSVAAPGGFVSAIKSVGLYGCTWLPKPLQPKWPASARS
jgi:glycosyltransferase involved in cell wall biosynthesis